MLGRLLASDQDLFVGLVSVAYRRSSDQSPPNLTRDEQNRAMNAYRLLDDWSIPPGTGADGQLDGAALADWVSRALEGLEQAERLRTGTRLIGRVLARAPKDADGSWPCRAIRGLFQQQRSEELENGFFAGVVNDRGATSRTLEAGGELERSLTEQYRGQAERSADQWPRTATLLRSLSDYYEREARGEDNSAERFRRGMDE
jgi:hypothetical protein